MGGQPQGAACRAPALPVLLRVVRFTADSGRPHGAFYFRIAPFVDIRLGGTVTHFDEGHFEMPRRFIWIVIVGVAAVAVFAGGWSLSYDEHDSKNIRYVLWKLGAHSLDLDSAVSTMAIDPARDEMILGKSEGELRSEFGYLTPMSSASPRLKYCYWISPWYGKRAFLIRKGILMVIIENGRATDVVVMKAC
jgi:hypothetical protein